MGEGGGALRVMFVWLQCCKLLYISYIFTYFYVLE